MRRNLALWLALGAMVLAVLTLLLGPVLAPPGSAAEMDLTDLDDAGRDYAATLQSRFGAGGAPTAFAPISLALIDGLTLWTIALFATATLVRQSAHARVRAVVTPLFCLLVLVLSVIAILLAFAALMTMLTLFLAAPFGTIVYMLKFGSFGSSGVVSTLAVATLLRFAAFVCLLISSWRFLKNKTLLGLVATGYVLALVAGLIFGLLPGFLHAIADAVLAIVIGVVAAVWSVILLARSIPGLRAAVSR